MSINVRKQAARVTREKDYDRKRATCIQATVGAIRGLVEALSDEARDDIIQELVELQISNDIANALLIGVHAEHIRCRLKDGEEGGKLLIAICEACFEAGARAGYWVGVDMGSASPPESDGSGS